MEITNIYIYLFYCFIAALLPFACFWVKPGTNGWLFYIVAVIGVLITGAISHFYILVGSALIACLVSILRFRHIKRKNKPLEVIFISDHDDHYLHHFLEYYREDIIRFFPGFDFKIEEEYLVALLISRMETVGLIIAEIKNEETLRICIDYIIPKHRQSQLANTFYNCELRCIDFLGYEYLYIEPQSKAHNDYLERIGFVLVDGKYVNHYPVK
jgi:hypothetical protein